MGVDMVDRRIGEQATDHRICLAGLRERGVGHHPVVVEGAQRQDASFQCQWDFIRRPSPRWRVR